MFNVASIVIRQDGVGYGGSSMKFEMQMDKEFANKLKDSHKRYTDNENTTALYLYESKES